MLTRTYLLAALVLAGPILTSESAFGQNYSSFTGVTGIYGVNVQNTGLAYTVSLDPGAYLIYNSTQYDITDIFGFWCLRGGASLTASGNNQNGWSWDQSTNGSGSIAGWHNPAKDFDILPGGQLTFTYTSLDQPNVEEFGLHMTFVQEWSGGNFTGFVKGPLNPVPEPAAFATLGLGAIALMRRRKRS
jgi:MYXO-CTERM domain-containing protein